ncbi:MAG TPA: murein biosynthesis integral membrane protein MurJ [Clostridia bacterium]|nr:murein biosynthesis integral membrane protein MurJ [Clostridia bacterium]
MSATRTLARAGLIVSAAFLVSRLLGYVRGWTMATVFGADRELDAFFAAFRLPDLIFQLVAAGALSSALIPIISGLLATDERPRAWRIVSSVTTLMLAGLLALSVVFFVAAPAIMPLITSFEGPQLEQTVELTRIMLLSPIFLALGSVATSVLNARGRFAAAAIAPSVYNLGMIFGAAVLAPALGTTVDGVAVPNPAGLAIGVVIGSLGHLLVQLRPLRGMGFRFEPGTRFEDPLVRKALFLMAPRAIGLGAGQITFVAMTAFATSLPEPGSLSAFNLGMLLLQIPLGVIGVPLGIVLLPALSRDLASGTVTQYLGTIGRALRLLLFVMFPIAALGMVLRLEIVELLFGYGAFSAQAVDLTATTFVVLLGGLAAHALIAVLARAFYAGQDTRTPVLAAIAAVAINVTVGALAVGPYGLAGLAFAIAAGAWLEASILLVLLRRRFGGFDSGALAATFGRTLLAGLIAGGLAFAVLAALDGPLPFESGKLAVLGRVVIAGGAGAVGYLAMSLVLRVPELPALVGVATELVRRPRAS